MQEGVQRHGSDPEHTASDQTTILDRGPVHEEAVDRDGEAHRQDAAVARVRCRRRVEAGMAVLEHGEEPLDERTELGHGRAVGDASQILATGAVELEFRSEGRIGVRVSALERREKIPEIVSELIGADVTLCTAQAGGVRQQHDGERDGSHGS